MTAAQWDAVWICATSPAGLVIAGAVILAAIAATIHDRPWSR